MVHGVLSVTMAGPSLKLMLFADNLDTQEQQTSLLDQLLIRCLVLLIQNNQL